jgi:hypothetical protein
MTLKRTGRGTYGTVRIYRAVVIGFNVVAGINKLLVGSKAKTSAVHRQEW